VDRNRGPIARKLRDGSFGSEELYEASYSLHAVPEKGLKQEQTPLLKSQTPRLEQYAYSTKRKTTNNYKQFKFAFVWYGNTFSIIVVA
jgi:hypothetical protein